MGNDMHQNVGLFLYQSDTILILSVFSLTRRLAITCILCVYCTIRRIEVRIRLYAIDAFLRHECVLPLTAIDAISRKTICPRLDANNLLT